MIGVRGLGKVSAYTRYGNYKMSQAKREYSQFLIIDDDPGIAKFLVTYLRQRGHTCEALTDGFQTAAWLSEHDCEVAIVDLKMPKVDGISLITFMHEMNPGLPIVVFTGVGYDEEQMHAALHAGANGYVSKNLPIEQLYCVLARVLATCQQRKRANLNGQQPVLAGAA
jgi:DNA-binding NtrC family response regulator